MYNRIGYLDALRGFVMLLVVLAHVPIYSYHQTDGMSFSILPTTFHLALFFFISGWFVNSGAVRNAGATKRHIVPTLRGDATTIRGNYDNNNRWKALKGKFVQLIVPTIVFYLLYCWMNGIDIVENLWNDKYKAGYWFCFVLFVFYLTLTISKTITEKFFGAILIFFFALAMIMLNTNMVTDLLAKWNIPNILCIQQWQYFIFFYLGYLAHLHQERFFSWLDDGRIMAVAIVLFIGSLLLWYKQPLNLFGIKASFLLWGVLGAALSFAFFRKNESWFSQQTYIGRTLQYVGRRTLDVYLLHFFFLPKNLDWVGNYVMGNGNQTVELFVSLAISIMVITLCLLTSNIIRLSPLLAHWVLGVKK